MNKCIRAAAILAGVPLLALAPSVAHACACGCGIFEVGTAEMMPTSSGATAWFQYDFMDQNKNWHGTSSAPAADNSDKEIHTNFYTAGGQYMFNRAWGVMAEVPYTDRNFKTDIGSPGTPDVVAFHEENLGDIRLRGVYSGFSDDMSTGVTFGVKLPTGEYNDHDLDRDTSIGTGSTDALLGAYHMGSLTNDGMFNWFTNGQVDYPVAARDGYRPGNEIDAGIGSYYNAGTLGAGKLSPLLQVLFSQRWHDSGVNADPADSGYTRIYLSPGVEYDIDKVKLYGDVELPVYQFMRGDQLVAPVLVKFNVGYSF